MQTLIHWKNRFTSVPITSWINISNSFLFIVLYEFAKKCTSLLAYINVKIMSHKVESVDRNYYLERNTQINHNYIMFQSLYE